MGTMIFLYQYMQFQLFLYVINNSLANLQHQKNALYIIFFASYKFRQHWMKFELFNVHQLNQFINFHQMEKKIPALSTCTHDIRYPMQLYVLLSSIQGLKVYNLWIHSGLFIFLLFPSMYDHDTYILSVCICQMQDHLVSKMYIVYEYKYTFIDFF